VSPKDTGSSNEIGVSSKFKGVLNLSDGFDAGLTEYDDTRELWESFWVDNSSSDKIGNSGKSKFWCVVNAIADDDGDMCGDNEVEDDFFRGGLS